MKLNIDYEHAIDFGHCDSINEARERLSTITNILNRILIIRQETKKNILSACATYKGEDFAKMSWENKMIRLSDLSNSSELMQLWLDADSAYRQVKNKQSQIIEDIMALKKIADITPN